MLGKHIRNITQFDMQPTDPQNDIKGTGPREIWNKQVRFSDHLQYKRQHMAVSNTAHPTSQPPQADWLVKVRLPKW